MPNYVYNRVEFDPADVEKVQSLVMSEYGDFDFNRIIPRPDPLNICSGSTTQDALKLLEYKAKHGMVPASLRERYPDEGDEPDPSVFYSDELRIPQTLPELRVFAELIRANKEKYGATDWYDWSCQHWGTKWNACEPRWEGNVACFDTAWSDPEPVLKELSRKLGIMFDATAEEESLAFCTIKTYCDGEIVERQEESELRGLALLGYSREEIVERYEDWCEDMDAINRELDSIFG